MGQSGVNVLKITKMHGLGNDFVVVREKNVTGTDLSDMAVKICARKLGVGADGLIVVCPSGKADVRMRIFNADGSEAEMCGNGIRCFAKYVYENGIVCKENMTVETLAGIMSPRLAVHEGKVVSVCVDMGEAFLDASSIPVVEGVDPQDFDIDVAGKAVNICAVLVGVPHAVVFVDDIVLNDVTGIGPEIEKHVAFPKNTNVDFVKVIDRNTIEIKTWERGAGLTLACGTGSCASAVAAKLRGYCDNKTEVRHETGSLVIELRDNKVYMSGPAKTVFSGELA